MLHIKSTEELQQIIQQKKEDGYSIGFVPTLGALHQGHMSLINSAKEKNDFLICSIFVNPTQFDDPEDLEKYPRTLESDIALLEKNDCDICFTPSVEEVYPNGQQLTHKYDIGYLENILEGETRPGHYQGVAQVVHRLLQMVQPDYLYLGQKDYQQVKVLSKIIKNANLPVEVSMQPIVREKDGLAMSSRNVRLTENEREVAPELYKTLSKCKQNAFQIPLQQLQEWAILNLNLEPLIEVDYVKFCDGNTLREIKLWEDAESIVLLAAIKLGSIRLIDNVIIS